MNIIIAGAGKVGFNLAKILSIAHNVIVVDRNADALQTLQENLDILPICGSVEDYNTFELIDTKQIDLYIAVTDEDNINLISAMVIDIALDVKRKFIRLQKPYFNHEIIKEKLGIDRYILPIQLATNTVLSLLKYPKANNVKTFHYTDYRLISVVIGEEFPLSIFDSDLIQVVGIERDRTFILSQEESIEISSGDLVYCFGLDSDMRPITHDGNESIKKCVVYGADKLGVSIANDLLDMGCEVKLIEKDFQLCQKADEELKGRANIINFKYGSHEIFENESLSSADMFITTTNNDEFNIIKSLEARDSGLERIVAINNEIEYYNLMHSLDITAVRGPKISAYYKIMEEINSTGVVVQKHFCGGKAVVLLRKVFADSSLIGKCIKPPKLSNCSLFYIRDTILEPLNDKIELTENDLILSFCISKESEKVQKWIYEL